MAPLPTYSQDDPLGLGRWVGVHRLLYNYEVDTNFYWHETRITTLEFNQKFTVSIDYITVSGDQMTFHMTDHTTRGPFTMPVATFRPLGAWMPLTAYAVNDLVTANGVVYLVIWPHVSGATFSAGANDGAGHNYYAAIIALPGSSLPTGGAVGQMLMKSTTADFSVTWGWPLPTGGNAGQILTKNTNTNQDASWKNFPGVLAPPPSPAGVPGYVLKTVDGSSTLTEWAAESGGSSGISAPPPSPAGLTDQVPATVDGTSTNMKWVTVVYAPPPSPFGAAGQALITTDGTTTSMAWTDILDLSLSTLRDGDQLRYDNATSKWKNRGVTDDDYGAIGATTITINPDQHPFVSFQPGGNIVLDNSGRSGKVGQQLTVWILTNGTTSYNVTIDSTSNWVWQGTLATGTVNNKNYVLTFVSDQTGKLYETSRIGPF